VLKISFFGLPNTRFKEREEHEMKRVIIAVLAAAVFVSASLPSSAGEPSYGFKFKGFVKADAMWDNARIHPGNFRLWVRPEEKNDGFYMTANQSRMGFDFFWDEETYKTNAYIEFDFYGAAPAANKAQPMLRHAYVKLAAETWELLFGQTWDVISPLNPRTVNYSVLWTQGNIGYRRPQMRFTFKMKPGEKTKLNIAAALSRNIGSDFDGDGFDDGADSGVPTFQGRMGLSSKMGDEGKLIIGASGHYGQEKYGEDEYDTPSWSINGDLAVKFTKKFAFLGEFFYGANLNQYLGGVAQGVTPVGGALPSMGGWAMLSVKATDRTELNLGYGFDDPDDKEWEIPDDSESYTLRDLNSEAFLNLMYGLTNNVSLMFEGAWMQTKYRTQTYGSEATTEDYDGFRFQFAVKADIK
jgi:hypothetical protein